MKRICLFPSLVACVMLIGGPVSAAPEIGQTEGKFAVELIRAASAEKYFDGAVTAAKASAKLASIGLIPSDQWYLDDDFTQDDLMSAYNKLVETNDLEPLNYQSSDEIIDEIVERLSQIFEDLEHTRTSNSPTTTRVIGL